MCVDFVWCLCFSWLKVVDKRWAFLWGVQAGKTLMTHCCPVEECEPDKDHTLKQRFRLSFGLMGCFVQLDFFSGFLCLAHSLLLLLLGSFLLSEKEIWVKQRTRKCRLWISLCLYVSMFCAFKAKFFSCFGGSRLWSFWVLVVVEETGRSWELGRWKVVFVCVCACFEMIVLLVVAFGSEDFWADATAFGSVD